MINGNRSLKCNIAAGSDFCCMYRRRSVVCSTRQPTRSIAVTATLYSRWMATLTRSTARTCVYSPSYSSTTRRSTTTSNRSYSTCSPSTTTRAAISLATSQRYFYRCCGIFFFRRYRLLLLLVSCKCSQQMWFILCLKMNTRNNNNVYLSTYVCFNNLYIR